MSSRRRLSLGALLGLLLVGLLAGGLWLGGHPEHLPGFAQKLFLADNDTRSVNEAIDRVAHDYYRPVGRSALASSSISGMLASLHDPYSTYLSPRALREFDRPVSFAGIGVSVAPKPAGLEVARVFDASPAQRAGLKQGELIVAVDGHPLHGLSSAKATGLIKGPPGTDVRLTLRLPGGHVHTVRVTRATIYEPVVASALRALHGIKLGWAYLATFSEGAHNQLRAAIDDLLSRGARGIVLDLRANGGGLVSEAQEVASIFIASGTIVTTRGRSQPTIVLRATGGAISASIPVVVLVDHGTASAAEIVTAALQDHRRATVVGVHTFGKGVFQELEPLASGGAIKLTVGEYFTPNGRNLGGRGVSEGAGITPEVTVARGVDGEPGLDMALSTLVAKVR